MGITIKVLLILLLSVSGLFSQVFYQEPSLGAQINLSHLNAKSLSLFWLFNEGSGQTVYDLSLNERNGTLTNMDETDWVPGRDGWALEFDGSNDHVIIPDVSVTTTFTYSIWIRPSSQTDSWGGIGGSADAFDIFYYRGSDSGGNEGLISFWFDAADHHNNTALINNIWSHFAIVVNAGGYTFYLNGLPDGTQVSGVDAFIFEILGSDDFADAFKGALSDIRIYNRALTSEEIWLLYTHSYVIFEHPLYGRVLAAAVAAAAVERRRSIITND